MYPYQFELRFCMRFFLSWKKVRMGLPYLRSVSCFNLQTQHSDWSTNQLNIKRKRNLVHQNPQHVHPPKIANYQLDPNFSASQKLRSKLSNSATVSNYNTNFKLTPITKKINKPDFATQFYGISGIYRERQVCFGEPEKGQGENREGTLARPWPHRPAFLKFLKVRLLRDFRYLFFFIYWEVSRV